jgi:alcohol dehydrogenase
VPTLPPVAPPPPATYLSGCKDGKQRDLNWTSAMIPDVRIELRKFVAPEFVYGSGALTLIGRYARNFGAQKALVVTDPGLIETGWARKATASLDAAHIPWAMFHDVTPNPKDHEVAAGVRFYQEHECDVIVAVGGGSAMDCAKGIAISSANNKNVLEFEGVDEVPMPGPPLICVPTTSGSSADVSQFAIIADTARKLKIAIVSKTVVPDVSLIDPATTTTMSAELTAATGLDALVHAMEAYVSNASSPVTDLNALGAIPLIAQNLVPAIRDPQNLEYRNNMMLGSLLAGLAFSNASLGLVHSMAHSLGGLLDLPHGVCNALLLDHVVDFNYPATGGRYDKIAEAMGIELSGLREAGRKEALLQGIAELRKDAGVAATIGALGVKAADIPQLAKNAFDDACSATNPRKLSAQDIEQIYERAFSV